MLIAITEIYRRPASADFCMTRFATRMDAGWILQGGIR